MKTMEACTSKHFLHISLAFIFQNKITLNLFVHFNAISNNDPMKLLHHISMFKIDILDEIFYERLICVQNDHIINHRP